AFESARAVAVRIGAERICFATRPVQTSGLDPGIVPAAADRMHVAVAAAHARGFRLRGANRYAVHHPRAHLARGACETGMAMECVFRIAGAEPSAEPRHTKEPLHSGPVRRKPAVP